jgi:hypothetical protein
MAVIEMSLANWLVAGMIPGVNREPLKKSLTSRLPVPLHDADPVPDHEPGGGLLGDRNRECGAGQFERAADRQRLVAVAFEPFLDVKIEAGQPVVALKW